MALSRIEALKSYLNTSQHLKNDLKQIFWFLAVQKHSSLMIIVAARA